MDDCLTCGTSDCTDLGTGSGACTKLTSYNNEKIKPIACIAAYADPCDLGQQMAAIVRKQWCMNQNMIKNICKLWSDLGDLTNRVKSLEDRADGNDAKNQEQDDRLDSLEECCDSVQDELDSIHGDISNINNVIQNIQNDITNIYNILDQNMKDGYVTVTNTYRYTLDVSTFVQTAQNPLLWWSGLAGGENYISIPITEMDFVDTVVAQPLVLSGSTSLATVSIQSADLVGQEYQVNFDAYELVGSSLPPSVHFPYDLTIDFIVIGRKRVIIA